MNDTNLQTKKPSKRFVSQLSWGLTLWANVSDEGRLNFSLKKRYKVKDTGEYKDSSVLFPEDLAALSMLIPQAVQWADEQAKSKGGKVTATEEIAASDPSVDDIF